jgi:hypothetical protein
VSANEDTIVQVRSADGTGWVDYARTDRASALAALAARRLPGHRSTEELRAIDWITHEEVTMPTTDPTAVVLPKPKRQRRPVTTDTLPAATELDPETVAQLRSERANGVTLAELRKAFPSLSSATIRKALGEETTAKLAPEEVERRKQRQVEHADHEAQKATTAKKATRAKAAVSTRRVAPVEPTRDQFGKGTEGTKAYRAAHKAYEAALEEFRAGNTAEVRQAEKKAPAKRTKSQPKAPAAKSAPKSTPNSQPKAKKVGARSADMPEGWSWTDPKLAARVLKLKTEGQGRTIKQVTEALGLPAREGVWHQVSLVYRKAADSKGLARPRRTATEEKKAS